MDGLLARLSFQIIDRTVSKFDDFRISVDLEKLLPPLVLIFLLFVLRHQFFLRVLHSTLRRFLRTLKIIQEALTLIEIQSLLIKSADILELVMDVGSLRWRLLLELDAAYEVCGFDHRNLELFSTFLFRDQRTRHFQLLATFARF